MCVVASWLMHRYKIIQPISDGAFGVISKAVSESGEIVAVKKMKHRFRQWQECMELREVKALKRLSHPNIIKLREVIREGDELYFVFEYCEQNLFQLMRGVNAPGLREDRIRLVMFQILRGLHHLHKNGMFHRDLKPENVLCSNGVDDVKLADFGLAREVDAVPPLTEYVSTRWYRAPEILFKFPVYSWQVDIWAAGAVFAELYLMKPLFPGTSEADEIYKICVVLGAPSVTQWPELETVLKHTGASLPTTISREDANRRPLRDWVPNMDKDAVDLLGKMLCWNPGMRPSARQCLKHPYFESVAGTVATNAASLNLLSPSAGQ